MPEHPVLKVVIGYEDVSSGHRAMSLYRRVLEAQVAPAEFKIWKFEPLGMPELFERAVVDAVEADLLVVSICGNRPIPIEGVRWLEASCRRRGDHGGAIIFVAADENQQHPARCLAAEFLRKTARMGGLDYFGPPTCTPNTFSRGDLSGFHSSQVADAVVHATQYERWGLNE